MGVGTGWFDAHLDLAYLAEGGRDMAVAAERVAGPMLPASVTFPSLAEGNIRAALGTIFIQQRITDAADPLDNSNGTWTFDTPDEAYVAAMRQVERYAAWEREGKLRIVRRGGEFSEAGAATPLQMMILMEGAAGVRTVGDLPGFVEAGVRVLSLCWAAGTRYAGGNSSGEDVSKAGREMIGELDKLGVVHDVSHLSEKAFWTMMKVGKGPKIASHSNCRKLLPGARSPERHLTDEQIRAVVDGGGMIGVVLFSHFLVGKGRATVGDVLRHVEHIEKVTGRRDCIGLGSDMDGGFSAEQLPVELDHPRKFGALAGALRGAGWSEGEVAGFMYGNWAGFFGRALA